MRLLVSVDYISNYASTWPSANSFCQENGGHLVTSSSFVEVPFEFKCFDISDGRITMATHCLVDEVNLAARYDHGKAFVQGRVCDRTMA